MFGDNLICEYPKKLNFHLDKKSRREKIDNFITKIQSTYNMGNEEANIEELLEFLAQQNEDTFFENKVKNSFYIIKDDATIAPGSKVVRAFKYFIKDEIILKELQSLASQIIQEDKLTGTLCFSIHPLDFLTISENNYNWSSCHSLHGDYRAGNLTYMTDTSTFICYIKGDNDYKNIINWNSKKWRVLLFASDNYEHIAIGREYPFITNVLEYIAKNDILSIIGFENFEEEIDEEVIDFYINKKGQKNYLQEKYMYYKGNFYPINKVVSECGLAFNDLLYSSYYIPRWMHKKEQYSNDFISWALGRKKEILTPHFSIGSPSVKCLRCGNGELIYPYMFHCEQCEEKYGELCNDDFCYCDECGRHISRNNAFWIGDSALVCGDCYDRYGAVCSKCDNSYYISEMEYNEEEDSYICPWCLKDKESTKKHSF